MSETIKQTLERVGLIPVLRARNAVQGYAVVEAMVAGGITVVEVTMTVPGALELLQELKIKFGNKLLLGSGTVTTAADAEATIAAGAEFVVSPSFHPDVIAMAHFLGKISIPGALTPTEVICAWRAGGDYVKVFPCSALGGASYLRALLAPFPHLKLIPTGGVTLQSAETFLRAGARALGVGSDLVNLAAADAGDLESITTTSRAYLEILAKFRAESLLEEYSSTNSILTL
jgi:2-dehydro-3-deoxyphosphogluconate aldolase / (4S)-4-hydroxy-2-oxoglutarate aldolase